MKTKIISVLLVILLSISITGCLGTKNRLNLNNSSSTINNNISDTSVPTNFSSTTLDSNSEAIRSQILSNKSVLEAYKAVLQNKSEFFSTDNKKKLHLNDFLTNKEIYGAIFKVTHFTVLDMDGDNAPEVILELSLGDKPELYEVLHYMDNTVYGYLIVYRGLEELKADGTFRYSNGSADNGFGKLKFQSDAFKTDILGYSKSSQGNTNLTITYFINNKQVAKESFDSFSNEQSRKKHAVWHEFSQSNIETELNTSQNTESTSGSIDASKSPFQKGYYDYKGTIGNDMSIHMSIFPLGKDMVGSYFYDSKRGEIKLKGKAGEKDIVLYEYNDVGENTGIFRGTMSMVDKIEGTWLSADGKKSYPFTLSLQSILPGVEYGKRYEMAVTSHSDQEVENYVSRIQGYVKNNNKEQFAELVKYPITVKINGKAAKIENKADFIKNYDQIFNPAFKQAISNAFTKYLFANSKGIMFGEGLYNIWIIESNSKLVIVGINN
jgi:hypothetical protein